MPPQVIIDPHFHMWSASRPNANLGDMLVKVPLYDGAAYAAEAAAAGLALAAAVHVETVVGQCAGGAVIDAVDESAWVAAQLSAGAPPRPGAVVAFASLTAPPAALAAQLDAHARACAAAGAAARLAGVRMILNFDAGDASLCWPQVALDVLAPAAAAAAGGGTAHAAFCAGLAELAARGLSFDLQCNPAQLAPAAAAAAATPGLRVVLNHLGCPRLGRGADADAAVLATWRAGMAALAAVPGERVAVKASMLTFIREGWLTDAGARAQVTALVREVIALFGAHRVMFASNFPVDKVTTGSLADIYAGFRDIAAVYSPDEQRDLFANSAARAYGLPLVA